MIGSQLTTEDASMMYIVLEQTGSTHAVITDKVHLFFTQQVLLSIYHRHKL